jgi:hypothetical protein
LVQPALARLRQQRQLAEPRQPGIGVGQGGRLGRPERVQVRGRAHDRPGLVSDEHGALHAEAPGEGEQVAHGDRPPRGHRLLERAVRPDQHPTVGQLGQQLVDRPVQFEQAGVDQREDDGSRDRLGHGRDAEERVAPHRRPADGHHSCRRNVEDVAVRDAGHHARCLSLVNRARGDLVDSIHARPGLAAWEGGRPIRSV